MVGFPQCAFVAKGPLQAKLRRTMKSTGRLASVAWALAPVLVAGVLCVLPLFSVLGFESCLVLALVASALGIQRGIRAVCRRQTQPPAPRKASSGQPWKPGAPAASSSALHVLTRLFVQATSGGVAVLMGPLLVLLLNGLRVRNCSYLVGLGFYALLPGVSLVCGVVLGMGCALGSRRPRLLAAAFFLGSLACALKTFLSGPAIFSYGPFFGFYPGSLYDEELTIGTPLLWARLLHLLVCATALLALGALTEPASLRLGLGRIRNHLGTAIVALGLGLLSLGLFSLGGQLGFRGDVPAVQSILAAQRRTPHFLLRYRAGGPVEKDIELLAKEHELRYAQLVDRLGVEPTWRPGRWGRLWGWFLDDEYVRRGVKGEAPLVVSYLFDSVHEKRRAMGAGYTYIAKPWRREMYLHHESWPHPVLRHELAHLFAGAAGDSLFRVALQRGLPNPGLIEGLAMAADWRNAGDLSTHQEVQALAQAGQLPPLSSVFTLGFYRLPPVRAYAVAGSFCRFLLTQSTEGKKALLTVYQRGGSPQDFATVYGRPFADLEADWRAMLAQQPLAPAQRDAATEKLRRKPVFAKVCAHDLAVRRQQASAAAMSGDLDRALRLLDSVCSDDPQEPRHVIDKLEVLLQAHRWPEAEQVGQTLLSREDMLPALRSRVESRLGDLAVLRGQRAQAAALYEAASRHPESEALTRSLLAKRTALSSVQAGPLLLQYLVGSPQTPEPTPPRAAAEPSRDAALGVYVLRDAIVAEPDLGLSHYLLGRLLFEHQAYDAAQAELGLATSSGLPDERFVLEAQLLRGQAALLAGRTEEAIALFSSLLKTVSAERAGKQLEIEDFLDRARRWQVSPSPQESTRSLP